MNKIAISIIIPVFNTKDFIVRCAESLFSQTINNIEFIFVDDASSDDSIRLLELTLERFPDRKPFTKILKHTINKGSGAARTTGIEHANGEYIGIVDSDDYVDNDMFEALLERAQLDNADVVVSDIIFEYIGRQLVIKDMVENVPLCFEDVIRNTQIRTFSCNKIVRKALYLIPECKIPENLNFLEDRHVMTRVFFYAERVSKVNKAYYHYTQYRKNSITKQKNRMHFENVLTFWNELDAFLRFHEITEKYREVTSIAKLQTKCDLMIDTDSLNLRKEFASIFSEEEKEWKALMKRGEKIMLFLIGKKLFILAQIFHILLKIKNKHGR